MSRSVLSRVKPSIVAGLVAFVIALVAAHGRSTPYNNYTLFASALLHGRLWIDWPGPYIDAVAWNGHRFIVNDPMPGLLMIPLVLFFGLAANQTYLAVILCAIAVGAAWELCERLGASRITSTFLCAFLLCATDLLWTAMLGDVWFIAQTSCVCFMLLALLELAGKNRPWVVALAFTAAIASRFTVVMATPVIIYLMLAGGLQGDGKLVSRDQWRARALQMLAVFVPAVLLYVTYNQLRWGVPWDSGHTIFFHQDAIGGVGGSPFSIAHVPYQLWSFFVQLPAFVPGFPWIVPSLNGVALTWTEPALALAFFARGPWRIIAALWLATFLAAGPNLLYYVNGFAQYGMRHSLDFMPFLFVLMIFAVRKRMNVAATAVTVYSCLAGLYGVWFWNVFVRPGN